MYVNYRRKSLIRPDWTNQCKSCEASDCHWRKMFHRLDQTWQLQWQSEERQICLPVTGGSCTDWSNLRYTGRIYDFRRYKGQDSIFQMWCWIETSVSGFSNMFFKHADEERAHGLKFIDYLRMRGNLDEDFFSSLKPIKSKSIIKLFQNSWANRSTKSDPKP